VTKNRINLVGACEHVMGPSDTVRGREFLTDRETITSF
jgi:hypothetical protein